MKRMVSLVLAAMLLIGCMPVNAAIAGDGEPRAFVDLSRNAPSNGKYCATSTIQNDPDFGKIYRYETKGVANATDYTSYKLYMQFDGALTKGDYVFLSFYYRVVTNATYTTTPTELLVADEIARNTAVGTKVYDHETYSNNTWHYVQKVAQVYTGNSGAQTVLNHFLAVKTAANTDRVCVEFADPKCVYMGAVTGDNIAGQITEKLGTTSLKGLTLSDTVVDLEANPQSYSSSESYAADQVQQGVQTLYGNADKVIVTTNPAGTTHTIRVYAPAVDYRSESATPTLTYTVETRQATVDISENNGYGTPLVYYGNDGAFYKNVSQVTHPGSPEAKNRGWLNLTQVQEAPFNNVTRIASIGTNEPVATNQIRYAFDMPTMQAGDYVYLSFYYRYNATLDGADCEKPTSFYVKDLSDRNTKLDTIAPAGQAYGEWYRYEKVYQLKANVTANDVMLPSTQKPYFELTFLRRNDDINEPVYSMDVADVSVLYFGKPDATSASLILPAIQQSLTQYGLSKVFVDGEEVKAQFPTGASFDAPCYSANQPEIQIDGESLHGRGHTVVRKNDAGGYSVYAYAPAYNLLDPADTRFEKYDVTVRALYDFYDFALKCDGSTVTDYRTLQNGDYTFDLKVDNGQNAALTGKIVGFIGAQGSSLSHVFVQNFDVSANASDVSISIPLGSTLGEGNNKIKFMILDGFEGLRPYTRMISIDQNGITQ